MTYLINDFDIFANNGEHIIDTVCSVCSKQSCGLMIVGAIARDIILKEVYDFNDENRATFDIDFAIAISDWGKFSLITSSLVSLGFVQDKELHRLLYNGTPVDIVPFGSIERNGTISWPPKFTTVMNVFGFSEVYTFAKCFKTINGNEYRVVSILGLIILKLIAWSERKLTTKKDGEDILYLLNNYSNINPDSIFEDNSDLLDKPNYDFISAGAIALAREFKRVIHPSNPLLPKIADILNLETNDIDESQLSKVSINGADISQNFNLLCVFKEEILSYYVYRN